MSDNNLIQSSCFRVRIPLEYIGQIILPSNRFPSPKEDRQISPKTVFHDKMYMASPFQTVIQADNVGVVEAFQDVDLVI